MKYCRLLPVIVLQAGCAAAPPQADKPEAAAVAARFEAGPGPYSFNCNARPGHYSEHNAHIPDGMYTVKGVVQFVGLQSDAEYPPMAAVELAGLAEDGSVGLTAWVDPYKPGDIQLGIRNGLRRIRTPVPFATIKYTNATIPFSLTLQKPGSLFVTVGDFKETVSFPVSASLTRVRMLCATGHVRFSDVTVTNQNQ